MDRHDHEKVLARIKKLLALAVDKSNPNESENAMLMAQKLMAEHNVEMADVEDIDVDHKPDVVQGYATYVSRNMPWWYRELARIISKNFRVKYLLGTRPQASKSKKAQERGEIPQDIIFVGLKEDVQIAVEVYRFAIDAIKYHADRYARKMYAKGAEMYGLRDSFTEGFLKGLEEKFKTQVTQNNWLMVLDLHPAVIDYLNQMNIKERVLKTNRNATANDLLHAMAYEAGREEGKKFQIAKNALKD